jgi:hypothetical protein
VIKKSRIVRPRVTRAAFALFVIDGPAIWRGRFFD